MFLFFHFHLCFPYFSSFCVVFTFAAGEGFTQVAQTSSGSGSENGTVDGTMDGAVHRVGAVDVSVLRNYVGPTSFRPPHLGPTSSIDPTSIESTPGSEVGGTVGVQRPGSRQTKHFYIYSIGQDWNELRNPHFYSVLIVNAKCKTSKIIYTVTLSQRASIENLIKLETTKQSRNFTDLFQSNQSINISTYI